MKYSKKRYLKETHEEIIEANTHYIELKEFYEVIIEVVTRGDK